MKRNKSFRALLGITQEEAAMFLKVSRSQLSLYELNLRDIPGNAMIKLHQAWQFADAAQKISEKELPFFKEQQKKQQEILKEEIAMNQLEQMKIQRKLNKILENYQSGINAFYAIKHWKKETEDNDHREKELLEIMEGRAWVKIDNNGRHVQEQYQMKLEVLGAYEKLLKERMKNLK